MFIDMTENENPNSRYNILVVEDQPIIRDRIHGDLAKMGYTVRSEAFPSYALEEIEMGVPDLIITDNHMPGMSGCEMVKQLRADPKTRGIKIIGYGDFPDNAKGFDFILEKRIVAFGGREENRGQLYEKIRELLGDGE